MKFLIVGNWKCNPSSLSEAKIIFSSVEKGIKKVRGPEAVICPPFIYLPELKKKSSKLKLGAQNCFWEEGAFTGEVSAKMIKKLGCKYIIVGHSERRHFFKEKNLAINKKVHSALQNGLKTILCVGETEEEKKKGRFSEVIRTQIEKGLKKVSSKNMSNIAIAYEPVWAIGTGRACKPVEAQVTSLLIRKVLTRIYSRRIAEKTPVLYGGSVKKENALSYLRESGMAGLLIGGASLKPQEFVQIVKDASSL